MKTIIKISSSADGYPIGSISYIHSKSNMPYGWSEANGVELLINKYKELYDMIGRIYSPHEYLPRTLIQMLLFTKPMKNPKYSPFTFNLPDLRERVCYERDVRHL